MKSRACFKLIALVLAIATAVPAAGASTASVQYLRVLSGESAFPPACSLHPFGHVLHPDVEFDTRIAVNPRDPQNIVAVWIQGGQLGVVVAVSRDGGDTWRQVVVPGLSGCSGADDDSAAEDPQLAFDRDGTLYLASFNFSLLRPLDRVLVTRSTDGGETWEKEPKVVPDPGGGGFNGELWLATDPHVAGRAYLVWSRTRIPNEGGGEDWPTWLSRTTDGGNTWSPAETIYQAETDVQPQFPTVRVVLGRRLLNAFLQVDNRPDSRRENPDEARFKIMAIPFDEGARDWSTPPVRIAETCGNRPLDPETGLEIAASANPSLDVAPDGTAYAAWHAIRCNGQPSRILFSKSSDGGATWSVPRDVKSDAVNPCFGRPDRDDQAFQPTLSVRRDGTIGITYYDVRNDCLEDGKLTTDVWFAHSHDGGTTWREAHVAGPFDARAAFVDPTPAIFGRPPAFTLGGWYGLAPLPSGFAASFAQASAVPSPTAEEPPQDIFFARLRVPERGMKTTGGGWLANGSGRKLNFGFAARETAVGFEGEVRLNDNATGAKIRLNEVTREGAVEGRCGSVLDGPNSLELRGTGTYNERPASFRVCVQDGGEGASAQADLFHLACTDGCLYDTDSRTPDDAIDGGNIQVGQARGESDEPRPATVILDPLLQSEASVGEALAFTVRVYDQHQEPLANTSVALRARTSDGSVETLGGLTGASGTATIVTGSLAAGAEYQASAGGADSNAIALRPPLP